MEPPPLEPSTTNNEISDTESVLTFESGSSVAYWTKQLAETTHDMPDCLAPEPQEGKIEYKLKLVNLTPSRFNHLVTQMKWRLAEGDGEAVYELGVADNGSLMGLSEEEMSESLQSLEAMAKQVGAAITVLKSRTGLKGYGVVAEVLVRRVPDEQQYIDLRIALLGNADGGKSTLLGVLSTGEMDNGKGSARLNLFRHRHEIQSGRTSSVYHERIGFDLHGSVINRKSPTMEPCSPVEMCELAAKIVTLIDLAGHEKYIKTTITGLTAVVPDYVAVTIAANTGIIGTTLEHFDLAAGLHLPVFVIITKIDACTRSELTQTLQQVSKVIWDKFKTRTTMITKMDDLTVNAAIRANKLETPIFLVSSVSGKNIDVLLRFLNMLPVHQEFAPSLSPHFQISDVYHVADVGTVVGGILLKGSIHVDDVVMVGPYDGGTYHPARVTSIHRYRKPYKCIEAGQSGSVALEGGDEISREDIHPGFVLLAKDAAPVCCEKFTAVIFVVHGSLQPNAQAQVYIGGMRLTATVESLTFFPPPTLTRGTSPSPSQGNGSSPPVSPPPSPKITRPVPILVPSIRLPANGTTPPVIGTPRPLSSSGPSSSALPLTSSPIVSEMPSLSPQNPSPRDSSPVPALVPGESYIVVFRLRRPEFIEKEQRLLVRTPGFRAMGEVASVTLHV